MLDWLTVVLSRLVNVLTFGSPREMFCTRAHRNQWTRITDRIDEHFIRRGRKPEHCRRIYDWDRHVNRRPR